jgi:O-antigen/teichoic acid export membrane protein
LAGKYVLLAFGADYQASYHFVAILALGCPVFVVNTLFAGLMRVRQALAPVVLQGFTAAVVALTLAFVLGPTLGLSGFAISYDISQVCALVIVFVVTVRRRSDRHISSLTGQPTAG